LVVSTAGLLLTVDLLCTCPRSSIIRAATPTSRYLHICSLVYQSVKPFQAHSHVSVVTMGWGIKGSASEKSWAKTSVSSPFFSSIRGRFGLHIHTRGSGSGFNNATFGEVSQKYRTSSVKTSCFTKGEGLVGGDLLTTSAMMVQLHAPSLITLKPWSVGKVIIHTTDALKLTQPWIDRSRLYPGRHYR
jgi:hypothetical protein